MSLARVARFFAAKPSPEPDQVRPQPDEEELDLSQTGCIVLESGDLRSDGGDDLITHGETQLAFKGPDDGGMTFGRTNTSPRYLDDRYEVTRNVPRAGKIPKEGHISRAHFWLKSHPDGIVFVNGVPSDTEGAGGIRPPTNGTDLLAPDRRELAPCEEYLIPAGTSARFSLAKGKAILTIRADPKPTGKTDDRSAPDGGSRRPDEGPVHRHAPPPQQRPTDTGHDLDGYTQLGWRE